VQREHLAAMELAFHSPSAGRAAIPSSDSSRQRRLRRFAVPVAATVGVLGLTCGLAAAGALPARAQREASRVAATVGWNIPGSNDSPREAPSGNPGTGTSRTSPSPGVTTRTSPQRSNRDDAKPTSSTVVRSQPPSTRALPSVPVAPPGQTETKPGNSGSGSGTGGGGGSGTEHKPDTSVVTPGKSGDEPGNAKSAKPDGGAPGTPSATSHGRSADPPGDN
jgi:hypothetical protein